MPSERTPLAEAREIPAAAAERVVQKEAPRRHERREREAHLPPAHRGAGQGGAESQQRHSLHRDIKSDNVLVKLLKELGLADRLPREPKRNANQQGGASSRRLWLRQALIAQEALHKGAKADADFYEGKVAACQFFFRYHLPQAAEKLRYVASQDQSVLEAQARWFTAH